MEDSDSGNAGRPAWARVLAAVLASWPATLRAGFLVVLLVLLLVAIRLLAVELTVGPVEVGTGR